MSRNHESFEKGRRIYEAIMNDRDLTYHGAAALVGITCSNPTARNYVKSYTKAVGLAMPTMTKISTINIAELVIRHENGESYRAIGESVGLSREYVFDVIRDYKRIHNA